MIPVVILLTWLMMTGTDGRDLPLERSVIGKKLQYLKYAL